MSRTTELGVGYCWGRTWSVRWAKALRVLSKPGRRVLLGQKQEFVGRAMVVSHKRLGISRAGMSGRGQGGSRV